MNNDIIEGRNPIIEALKSNRPIEKILVVKGDKEGSVKKILGMAKDMGIQVQHVERAKLNKISTSNNHQGVIAYVQAYDYSSVESILDNIPEGEDAFIIVLDEINDPHNLGSILRTASCVGAHGVIIPKRRAVGLTATVAKTSAGAIEYVPVAKVTNIAKTLDELQDRGVWVMGADMAGDKSHYEADLTGNIALVIGNEGKGISRLVKEKCDFLVSIPMKGQVNSLNASVAASVLMYEAFRQKEVKKGDLS